MDDKQIDDLFFIKCPEDGKGSLRDEIYKLAENGERVGHLIDRATAAKIGTRKQIRAAIYMGAKAKGSKFKLKETIE